MEELWALSHAKFLLQHIRLGHDLLWHDIKKQFCFFLYPELNEGFIFRLWLMPMLIIMYLFKHLYGIMHRCLHSRAAHNPLITWVFRGAYFVPVGILFPPINFLVIPFHPLFCHWILAAAGCVSLGWKGRAAASAARVPPALHGIELQQARRWQIPFPRHCTQFPRQHSSGPLRCPALPQQNPSLLSLAQQSPGCRSRFGKDQKRVASTTSFQ